MIKLKKQYQTYDSLCFLSKSIVQDQNWRLENCNGITIQMAPAIWNVPCCIVSHSWRFRTVLCEVPVPLHSGSPGTVFRNQSKSLPKHHLLNWIVLENRAQVVKTLQIFSYASVNTYSWTLFRQHGLVSAELRCTQRFIKSSQLWTFFGNAFIWLVQMTPPYDFEESVTSDRCDKSCEKVKKMRWFPFLKLPWASCFQKY